MDEHAGSAAFEDHLVHPRGRGALARAPHAGAAGGARCGDVVRFAVRVEGGRVAEAGYDAGGCGAALAAGSAAVELVAGAPVLEAARVGAREIAAELGGLSPGKLHAADLAADALHRALGAAAAAGAVELPASPRRTLVAMSGGVDSAVAARLAREAGHEVVAVTLELWRDAEHDGERSCCSAQAVLGARALAHRMGLPHLTLDVREPFRELVVADYVAGHAAGTTPNPCVRCNGLVRFDAMLALAASLGASRLATGHYARVARDAEGPLLRLAADPAKDQAYALARLAPEQLERLWLPLGERRKPEVRALARAAGLPVADRPDSQDLCFLSGVGRERFLARHGGAHAPRAGEIVALDGSVLGRHDGQQRFTVGQRRGLGVAGGQPLYVLAKDARSGRVTVGPRSALATRRVALAGARLWRPGAVVDRAKLRYRAAPLACGVEGGARPGRHARLALALAEPADRPAPGQLACLLAGELVVGHATVAPESAATPSAPPGRSATMAPSEEMAHAG